MEEDSWKGQGRYGVKDHYNIFSNYQLSAQPPLDAGFLLYIFLTTSWAIFRPPRERINTLRMSHNSYAIYSLWIYFVPVRETRGFVASDIYLFPLWNDVSLNSG